jgi:hypothetical protein
VVGGGLRYYYHWAKLRRRHQSPSPLGQQQCWAHCMLSDCQHSDSAGCDWQHRCPHCNTVTAISHPNKMGQRRRSTGMLSSMSGPCQLHACIMVSLAAVLYMDHALTVVRLPIFAQAFKTPPCHAFRRDACACATTVYKLRACPFYAHGILQQVVRAPDSSSFASPHCC